MKPRAVIPLRSLGGPPRADGFIDRRQFLKLMAASWALAGAACSGPPQEKIVPYVRAPEELLPGEPLFYATAITQRGYATGLLVESNMGRPTKVEGNPAHPASLGATDIFAQASVLQLWDPDRSQTVLHHGQVSTWDSFAAELDTLMQDFERKGGEGLRLLTGSVTSPTLARQVDALLARFPQARWHQYDPLADDHALEGSRLAFGQPVESLHHFDRAQTVLAIDGDFLTAAPGATRLARDFAQRRRDPRSMSRVYAVESTPTLAGAAADHRLPLSPDEATRFVYALSRALGVTAPEAPLPPQQAAWLDSVARALRAQHGGSLVVAGRCQSPPVHALVHALNHTLGNLGRTVDIIAPVVHRPVPHMQSLRDLVSDMEAGHVDTLVIVGGNPVYDAPVDLAFAERVKRVRNSIHLSLYDDETSALATWHLPRTHYLEHWSDARAWDGTACIVQPLIAPLYAGRSEHELLAMLMRETRPAGHDIVRDTWRSMQRGKDFDAFWRESLRKGVIDGSAATPLALAPRSGVALPPLQSPPPQEIALRFIEDPTTGDGSWANLGWLQELPKPLTSLTWDNVAYLGPALAAELGVQSEDLIELEYRGLRIEAPAWVTPGEAARTVSVSLGYGRTRAGRVGTGVGFNANALRWSDAPWEGADLRVRKTGRRHPLACRQRFDHIEGREIVRAASRDEFARHPAFAVDTPEKQVPRETLYPSYSYPVHAWAMAIDLNACIGCGACTIACQAENNIPVVGKEQVRRGHAMHWIRVDRYHEGPRENPRTHFQPVPCMQCERAPCEEVCPVGATMHDSEGINVQVYNRCIGTRFCSNNCPYKVRRFNFLQFSNTELESLKALQNPEVTVRQRGVMEKCNYCLQRINRARIASEREGRSIRDGEVVTACQAACPTQAIVFGDLNDRSSAVAKAKDTPRNYTLLAELNTRPRTTYLAKVVNIDGALEPLSRD
jgi:molybdopterin-containing oxidoreductase family iron-sulfur binding subunit